MVRAPRSPEKLALSKARRDAADASVVMADKSTSLIDYEHRDGSLHVIVKATKHQWSNGTTTFTLETKNTLLPGNGVHAHEPYNTEAQLMDHAKFLEQHSKDLVRGQINQVAADGN